MQANMTFEEREEAARQARKEIGAALRNSREAFKLGIDAVSEDTVIPMRYIRALESGMWEDLPGEIYASGYIKTYEQYLGFEKGTMMAKMVSVDSGQPQIRIVPQLHRRRTGAMNLTPLLIAGGGMALGLALVMLYFAIPGLNNTRHAPSLPPHLQHYLGASSDTIFYEDHCVYSADKIALWPCYISSRFRASSPYYSVLIREVAL